jgi:hypothetical protein
MRGYGLLLIASVLLASPASAQFYSVPAHVQRPPTTISAGSSTASAPVISDVYADIRTGAREGQLSHKQAKELRREAGEISALETRYAADGLSDAEAAELQTRAEVLRSIVNAKRSGVLK